MSTLTVDGTKPQNWNLTVELLLIAIAVLGIALGIESYFLYRDFHHRKPTPVQRDLAITSPRPTARASNAISPMDDDWDLSTGPLVAANPWDQMARLHQQMDQLFNKAYSQFPIDDPTMVSVISSPNLDIREEKDHYTVRADMPGADKSSIKVNVEGRLLTISGQRTSVNDTKDNDKVVRSERSMAQFVRTVHLPGPVKAEAVDAKYENGVLMLTLPKAEQTAEGTQVPIH